MERLLTAARQRAALAIALAIVLAIGACAGGGGGSASAPAAVQRAAAPVAEAAVARGGVAEGRVAEIWLSLPSPADDLDSLAVWRGPAGEEWVLATAKQGHRLVVYDAGSGRPVRQVGGPGDGPGQFRRPKGIAVEEDLAWVVERDNRRVQVLALPGFTPLGSFGEEVLRKPYGLALKSTGPRRWRVWVTEDFAASNEEAPPLAELGERLRGFEVAAAGERGGGDSVEARFLGSAGATSGREALRKVESIQADAEAGRLLVADELDRELEVYGLDGKAAGERVGGPLRRRSGGDRALPLPRRRGLLGDLRAAAQRTRFHVLARRTLAPLGAFSGERTANTDGIALTQIVLARFPAGALFALHADQAVAAFDWRDVARALGLRADCAGVS